MNRIEISQPYINKIEALRNIEEALDTGQIAQGRQVALAEAAMKSFFDAKYASALMNGTASLRAALLAATSAKYGINKGYIDRFMVDKEVIIPSFSFNATLNTVLQLGATARLVDIDRRDFGISSQAAENSVNEKTVAVVPVDLYGQPANISNQDLAWKDIAVIRDAAQAHGATLNGESIVAHGDATSLSFYPTKNIAAPEGGAVLTNSLTIDEIVKVYRNQGMAQRYVYEMVGDNLRMTDIHAAVLRANLGSLSLVTAARRENAQLLSESLADVDGITPPYTRDDAGHVWHQYSVLVEDDFGHTRDQLASELNSRGISTGIYYPKVMNDHEAFKGHPRIRAEDLPIAQDVASRILSLPVHPGVSSNDIDRIVTEIANIRKGK